MQARWYGLVVVDLLEVFGWLEDGRIAFGSVGGVAYKYRIGFGRVRRRWGVGIC